VGGSAARSTIVAPGLRPGRARARIATQEPLQSTPGREFLYSNTDYVVLGLLVEKVTGHRYADELSRRVLHPAGLQDTYLPGHDPRLRQPSARGYEAVHSPARLKDVTTYTCPSRGPAGTSCPPPRT